MEYTIDAQKRMVVAGVVRDVLAERIGEKAELGVFTLSSDRKNPSPICFKVHRIHFSRIMKVMIPKGPVICSMTVELDKKTVSVEINAKIVQNTDSEKLDRFGIQSRELLTTDPNAPAKVAVDMEGWFMVSKT
ncbi:MAG: hypothetical protein U9P44_03450 [archaeon]|nr:hypothetical protein [archaeon]